MKTILRSTGLHCPSCAMKIEAVLKAMDGVSNATVHFTTGRVVVEHDPERAGDDTLARAVRAIGYDTRKVGSDG